MGDWVAGTVRGSTLTKCPAEWHTWFTFDLLWALALSLGVSLLWRFEERLFAPGTRVKAVAKGKQPLIIVLARSAIPRVTRLNEVMRA